MRQALAAGALGLALTLGGVWFGLGDQQSDYGKPTPYGAGVSLTEPLRLGDCVLANWPGAIPFQGSPQLTVDPTCRDKAPDGQVMAVVAAGSAAEARMLGPERCEERTRAIREKLADVRDYAVVPTWAGFEAAGRRTACLVLGAHGPVFGPLGAFRPYGMMFADATQIQLGDCLSKVGGDATENTLYELVACDKAHTGRVFRITHLKTFVSGEDASAEADAQCKTDAPPEEFGYSSDTYRSHGLRSKGLWSRGYYLVVCSIERMDKAPMYGDE
ncbi:septum formation family protein [Streptomyces sp. NBC_00268]|uniref:septum formation family protein n=1 Tax=Streptomyces sp. NBC_00268 TaxID=2975695 RepID=UPI002251E89D|nr:septum formation family protein [Streptomyces sp. NBC_00268]MCX5182563.1 septum formation family protein [Streptomyces sp. NBC_00268]